MKKYLEHSRSLPLLSKHEVNTNVHKSIQPLLHPIMLNFGEFCNVPEITLILNCHTMYLSFYIVAL